MVSKTNKIQIEYKKGTQKYYSKRITVYRASYKWVFKGKHGTKYRTIKGIIRDYGESFKDPYHYYCKWYFGSNMWDWADTLENAKSKMVELIKEYILSGYRKKVGWGYGEL